MGSIFRVSWVVAAGPRPFSDTVVDEGPLSTALTAALELGLTGLLGPLASICTNNYTPSGRMF